MHSPLLAAVLEATSSESIYAQRLEPFRDQNYERSLHLAVLIEPYLTFVLDGTKTVESRFSLRAIPPFGCVGPGDTVLLKAPGKPIVGICTATSVWEYELDDHAWKVVQTRFGAAIRPQDGFWESRCHARFATLLAINDVDATPPIPVAKRDRRGWVVLASPDRQLGSM